MLVVREDIHPILNEHDRSISSIIMFRKWLQDRRLKRLCRSVSQQQRKQYKFLHSVMSVVLPHARKAMVGFCTSPAVLPCTPLGTPQPQFTAKTHSNPTFIYTRAQQPTTGAVKFRRQQTSKMTLSRREPEDERQPLLNGTTAASVATGTLIASTNPSNVVEWDSPEDPENPRNFSTGRKTTIIAVLTLITVLSSAPRHYGF